MLFSFPTSPPLPLPPPPPNFPTPLIALPLKVCVYFTFLFLSFWFPLNLASMFASGCLSQTAVKHCDNAFRFHPCLFYDPLISFSFLPVSFPQGLAHLTLKSQGMGPFPFSFFISPLFSYLTLASTTHWLKKRSLPLSRCFPWPFHSLLSVCSSCPSSHLCPVHWPSPRSSSSDGHSSNR